MDLQLGGKRVDGGVATEAKKNKVEASCELVVDLQLVEKKVESQLQIVD